LVTSPASDDALETSRPSDVAAASVTTLDVASKAASFAVPPACPPPPVGSPPPALPSGLDPPPLAMLGEADSRAQARNTTMGT
jgi:hypothetical protein